MPPFSAKLPVRFSDVDHAGIVYYPVFLHYFHATMEEYLASRLGVDGYAKMLSVDHVGVPTVHVECDFRSPLKFGDEAAVTLSLKKLGTRSATLSYEVKRAKDGKVAATGHVVVAFTDLARFVAIEPPAVLRKLFLELGPDVG